MSCPARSSLPLPPLPASRGEEPGAGSPRAQAPPVRPMVLPAMAEHPHPESRRFPRDLAPGGAWLQGAAAVLAFVLVVLLASVALAQPKFPPLTGRIVDEAGLLGASDRAAIADDLKLLEQKSSDQLVIFTTRSLQGYSIEDFGYQLGRAWGIGQKGVNNGVILLVAPSERKVRIEVGRGLEPQLTDIMTRLIIENAILPAFRRGDFAAGIRAGVHDIRQVMLGDADAVRQRLASAPKRGGDKGSWVPIAFFVFFLVVAFSIISLQQVQTAHPNAARRRRGAAAAPVPYNSGGWGGSSGGWSGSSGSSGDSGGFSGGGGDFGGGGSSGSW